MRNSAHGSTSVAGRGRLTGTALLASCVVLACAATAWADVPDNRDVRFNPDDPVSPAYDETLRQRDDQRLQEAIEGGESFVTTVHGTGGAPGHGLPDALPGEPQTVGMEVDTRGAPAAAARPAPVYETAVPAPAGQDTEGGLAAMIGALLESWTRPPDIVRLRYAAPHGGSRAERTAEDPGPAEAEQARGGLPHIAAGTGFYARTLYAVDSGYPGPVLLELLQPPLAGAVAHGGFERVGTRLVLRLTSLTWRGRTFPVDAWAVDPECACYGVRGEVDRHFLSRVLLPAAARFAEGFLAAAAMPARTLTMQDGTVLHERGASGTEEALLAGAGTAARTLGDILTADAPKEATVRIPRNTPLVVTVARDVAAPPGAAAPGASSWERAGAGN